MKRLPIVGMEGMVECRTKTSGCFHPASYVCDICQHGEQEADAHNPMPPHDWARAHIRAERRVRCRGFLADVAAGAAVGLVLFIWCYGLWSFLMDVVR